MSKPKREPIFNWELDTLFTLISIAGTAWLAFSFLPHLIYPWVHWALSPVFALLGLPPPPSTHF